VGLSGLLVNSLLLALAVEWIGLHYLIGAVLSTQGSTLWNYLWTEYWVFGIREKQRPAWQRFGTYYLMNNVFLLFRAPLITLFTAGLGINYLIGNLLSIILLTMSRFLVSDRLIWSKNKMGSENKYYYYNIHNLLYLASSTRLPELDYFISETPPDHLDLRITTIKRINENQEQAMIVYDEGMGDLGFWLHIHRGEQTEVYGSPMLGRSPHVLYTNVVEPLLRWELARKGYALVHGACLSYKGRSLLVTAGTETGKTTTILTCLEDFPFDFVSDDMVILTKDGVVYNYPKPMTISLHTVKAVNTNNLTFMERVKLQFQSRLHSRLGRRIGLLFGNINFPAATLNMYVQMLIPPPKYPVERLIPHVKHAPQTNLCYILVIARGGSPVEEVLPMNVVSGIVSNNTEDAYQFPPYGMLVDQLSRWGDQDLKTEESQLIHQVMDNLPAVYLSRSDYNWWQRIPALFYEGQFDN